MSKKIPQPLEPLGCPTPGLQTMRVETARFFEQELQRIRFKTASAAQVKSDYKIEEADDEVWGFPEPLGGISLTLIEIPAGRFLMGSPNDEPERYSDEGPQHEVELRSFFLAQTPITQAQWRAVAGWTEQPGEQWGRELTPNPSGFGNEADSGQRPVERVSWLEAMEFCSRLSQRTGKNYTLPSEAQWEYACRAGSTTPFAFGATLTSELANYSTAVDEDGVPTVDWKGQTTEVGRFPANAWGLQDMHGNVWEWCADDWHGSYDGAPEEGSAWLEGKSPQNDSVAKTKKSDQWKQLRGGSWDSPPRNCRSASRNCNPPDDRDGSVGFRVCCLPFGVEQP